LGPREGRDSEKIELDGTSSKQERKRHMIHKKTGGGGLWEPPMQNPAENGRRKEREGFEVNLEYEKGKSAGSDRCPQEFETFHTGKSKEEGIEK